jgi:hypothetical protein
MRVGRVEKTTLRGTLCALMLATTACRSTQVASGPLPPVAPGVPQMPASSGAVDAWLAQHPNVAASLVWATERGPVPWAGWDATMRAELGRAFDGASFALQGRGPGYPLADPPANVAASSPHFDTVLAPADAFRLYVAHVGNGLALEALRRLPWSIANDTPESLAALFDARSMFAYRPDLGGYRLDAARAGYALPAPPAIEYGFMAGQRLIGATRRATIENLILWVGGNLHHVSGRFDSDNAERVWQYRGVPPVSRMITGMAGGQHQTMGCWGTTGFFIAVLRAVNVPVRLAMAKGLRGASRSCTHASPFFVSERLFLSHGDDPYNQLVRTEEAPASVVASKLLLDEQTYAAWFGESLDPYTRCASVGRQPRELSLADPPRMLLEAYCEDERRHTDRRHGQVAREFLVDTPGTAFPFARLEQQRLWERLAEKVRARGGCRAIPSNRRAPEPEEH